VPAAARQRRLDDGLFHGPRRRSHFGAPRPPGHSECQRRPTFAWPPPCSQPRRLLIYRVCNPQWAGRQGINHRDTENAEKDKTEKDKERERPRLKICFLCVLCASVVNPHSHRVF
jgi:hypothetical protein